MNDPIAAGSPVDPVPHAPSERSRLSLRLFVAGLTPRSAEALAVVRSVCEDELEGRCELTVIDIYHQPEQAGDDGIVVAPTLVSDESPVPRRLVSGFSDRGRLVDWLLRGLRAPGQGGS